MPFASKDLSEVSSGQKREIICDEVALQERGMGAQSEGQRQSIEASLAGRESMATARRACA